MERKKFNNEKNLNVYQSARSELWPGLINSEIFNRVRNQFVEEQPKNFPGTKQIKKKSKCRD